MSYNTIYILLFISLLAVLFRALGRYPVILLPLNVGLYLLITTPNLQGCIALAINTFTILALLNHGRWSNSSKDVTAAGRVSGQVNQVDAGMQIKKVTLAEGSEWRYDYNTRREVMITKKHISPAVNSAVANGYAAGYVYDLIGNRTSMTRGLAGNTAYPLSPSNGFWDWLCGAKTTQTNSAATTLTRGADVASKALLLSICNMANKAYEWCFLMNAYDLCKCENLLQERNKTCASAAKACNL